MKRVMIIIDMMTTNVINIHRGANVKNILRDKISLEKHKATAPLINLVGNRDCN